ncbi:DedA family protein [Bacillus cereus]|uniref:DedA family protein n=2 Tax=Bacillus cereus TaxID=1396 RepID=A0A2A8LTY0_BACCE|nr:MULTISPECIES: VTT domain-containing protein [Bacillus cereus group]MEA1011490.1 VTT domain-containing protein [Bacillus cereus]PES97617.1 DedA family protein [Bacillus cereus]PFP82386.1 DedA family protein [Bacillus cereus]
MEHLISLFEQHSYSILFTVILIELFAIPISAEFFMSFAGYFVFQGKMDYTLAILTAIAAGGVGITVTYWIGRLGGYKLIEKYGRYIHLGPKNYKKVAAWMERSGSKLLVVAYFITGVRHFTGYVSGISRMPYRTFFIPAYIGASLWAIGFITLGKILGPRWQDFHKLAGQYLIYIVLVLAIVIGGGLVYKFYKKQIKNFFLRLLNWLISYFRTIRATEAFLISLTLVLLGMITLMLGMALDYLYNEFTQFNEVTTYIVHSVLQTGWTSSIKGFLSLQSPIAFSVLIIITILAIWRKGRDRWLEGLLLIVSILGAHIYHNAVLHTLSYFRFIGKDAATRSSAFPDEKATITIIVFGTCLFLMVRHLKNKYIQFVLPLLGIVLLLGIAIANIAFSHILPSDIVGGYVYGGVWMFLNFLLFEMFRLIVNKQM